MWDTIKEIYLSIKKTSTDRIKSPFYGVFILTWLAFNWQPVSILLFSELKMENRIGFINAIYPFKLWLPLGIASLLAYILPVINEKVTFLQSKPISRTAVILAIRKKRALVADISVEKYRAKRDVTYDRHMAGSEKEIQDMREEILTSKERMGQINAERDSLLESVSSLEKSLNKANNAVEINIKAINKLQQEINTKELRIKELETQVSSSLSPLKTYGLGLTHGLTGLKTTLDTDNKGYKIKKITIDPD